MKKFRNVYLSTFLAYALLLTSCSRYDNVEKQDEKVAINSRNSSNNILARTTNDLIAQNKIIWEESQQRFGPSELQLTDEIFTLNDNDFETNWNKSVNTGLVAQADKVLFEQLGNDIINVDFETAISRFENAYKAKNYSGMQLSVYDNFVKVLKDKNIQDSTYFSRNNFDCGLAVVGFAVAAISLVSLTAATGGLLVGTTYVGYCVGSVALVRACRK